VAAIVEGNAIVQSSPTLIFALALNITVSSKHGRRSPMKSETHLEAKTDDTAIERVGYAT
jgi:hypothetical protein